jgi:glucokinase
VADVAGRFVIGVDLGGTKLLAGAVGADGTVGETRYLEIAGLGVDELVAEIAAVVAALGPVDAIGVGIPALVDRATGVARACVHLPLAGVAIGPLVSAATGVEVVTVDNDATCAAMAEDRGGTTLMLTIGTGIGGGLIVDGVPLRGARGFAPEYGHMTLSLDGPVCTCGARGCLETLVSGPALGRAYGGGATGAEVSRLALGGDADAVQAVQEIGRRLGVGVASLVNALDPDVVVIGGGLIALGDLLLEPARVAARSQALVGDRVRIEPARLGPEAGMVGAGLQAWRTVGIEGGGSGAAAAGPAGGEA